MPRLPRARSPNFVVHLHADRWDVHIVTTPTAAKWVDLDGLTALTGHPLRADIGRPADPKALPQADALAVVPATLNRSTKWAAGINHTLALGVLNEAICSGIPIVVAPYAEPVLAAHPAFDARPRGRRLHPPQWSDLCLSPTRQGSVRPGRGHRATRGRHRRDQPSCASRSAGYVATGTPSRTMTEISDRCFAWQRDKGESERGRTRAREANHAADRNFVP